MRIAFFSDNFYPELSGITDTIITTGRELRDRGHAVCYVVPSYSPSDYRTGNRPYPVDAAHDTVEGMPVFRIPSLPLPFSPTGQSRFAIPFWKDLSFLDTFRPNLIHSQSPYSVGWDALRASRRYHIPLVGTNHTAIEDFFPLPAIMRRYDAWYYNHCAHVTTPYSALISRMREMGFRQSATVMANPVETALFTPVTPKEREECKSEFGLSGPVILYTGRLGVEKNVDTIIKALVPLRYRFPTAQLVVTGHGAAEVSLRALAKRLKLEQAVHFVGFVPRPTLPRLYKAADVFTIMSTSDSQSIALMQAYATGIPAVCASARGLPDYTPVTCGYVVPPGDTASLAEKLALILGDNATRDAMGKAAETFVRELTPGHIAERWEQLFGDVLRRFGKSE